MIFFATVQLEQQVHAQALGFTRVIYPYIHAEDPIGADAVARRVLAAKGLRVTEFDARPALKQDTAKYAFPDQIWR
jgi:hypothetical protein